MKKLSVLLLAIALVVFMAATAVLSACTNGGKEFSDNQSASHFVTDEETEQEEQGQQKQWTFTADTIDEAQEIYDSFIYFTVYDDNFTVTATNAEGVFFIEEVDEYNDHIVYSEDYEEFGFKVGEEFYYAVRNDENKYYFVGEEKYDENTCQFTRLLDVFADLPENATVALTSKVTATPVGYDVNFDAVLTIEIKYDETTTNITVIKEKNYVTRFTCTTDDGDGAYTYEVAFERNNAEITIPDITDWFDASAPRVESDWYVTGRVGGETRESIPTYYDYMSGCYKTDYVDIVLGDSITIKNKTDGTLSYSQQVDAEFLTGQQMIVFDPQDGSIVFESEGDLDDGEPAANDNFEYWKVVVVFATGETWEDDKPMGLREEGVYVSDTIVLHSGDKIKVVKARGEALSYPEGENDYYVVDIESDAHYFVVFNPETFEISIEYDTVGNFDPSKINWGDIIGG